MASTIVEMVIGKAVSIENMDMPCSRNSFCQRCNFIKDLSKGLLHPCDLCLNDFSIL